MRCLRKLACREAHYLLPVRLRSKLLIIFLCLGDYSDGYCAAKRCSNRALYEIVLIKSILYEYVSITSSTGQLHHISKNDAVDQLTGVISISGRDAEG